MSFNHSPHQLAFFSELRTGSRSILLEAVAGSGKTTTIEHGCYLLPSYELIVYLAFGKKIIEEAKNRLPKHIQSGTFHSRCARALNRSLSRYPVINKDKTRDLLKENLKWSEFELYSSFVQKLVSLAKSAGIGTELCEDTESAWRELIARFALSLDSLDADPERALDITRACFTDSCENTSTIDFDDMLYLALKKNIVFDKAGFVFVDEAQDTNGVQRALLKRMLTPERGRLIAVGDTHQSIYGFRGADSSAMDLIAQEFNAIRLPLSVSYRCSKAVVREAQKYI